MPAQEWKCGKCSEKFLSQSDMTLHTIHVHGRKPRTSRKSIAGETVSYSWVVERPSRVSIRIKPL